jgi:hypothetical protein
MATHVLAREDLFPAGTTVGVYFGPLLSGSRTGAPPGGAVTSAVVQSNGTATFTNLLDSRSYVVYASVGGQDRYAQFRTPDIAVQTAVAPGGIQASVVDAKGDLLVGTASDTVGRLGVGANGQALTADSTTGTGLAWAAVAGGAASVPFILADAPTGVAATDTAMLDARTATAIAQNKPLVLQAGTYQRSSAWDIAAGKFILQGAGGDRTIVNFAAGSAGITIGPAAGQSAIGPTGTIADVYVTRTGGKAFDQLAGITVRGMIQFAVERCRAGGFCAAFDLINNCYGSEFRNCRALFSENYYGMVLREGGNSGSDLMFTDCWMSGEYAAYVIAGGGGGYHIHGGQVNMGHEGTTTATGAYGAIIFGRHPYSGAVGGWGHVDIIGVDVEGWNKSPAFHMYDQGPLTVIGCSFLPTVGGANAASNIVRHEDFKNTNLFFANNSLTGTLSGPAAVIVYTSGRDRGTLVEQGWSSNLPTVINGATFDHFNQFQSLGILEGWSYRHGDGSPELWIGNGPSNPSRGLRNWNGHLQLDNLVGSWQAEMDRTGEYTFTTSQVLVMDHWNAAIGMNAAGATTITVPPNSSVAFPVGTIIEVTRLGAGTVTFVAGAGVTLRSRGGLLGIGPQYGTVRLRKRATDEWVLTGDLV